MEIGVYTFAELRPDPEDRIRLTSTVSVIHADSGAVSRRTRILPVRREAEGAPDRPPESVTRYEVRRYLSTVEQEA